MRKRIMMVCILILALAALAGCRSNPQPLPMPVDLPTKDDAPVNILPAERDDAAASGGCTLVEYGVAGEILGITASDREDVLGTIEVKGELDNGAMYDYAMATITPDTAIYLDDEIGFEDLEVGMYVTVFFDGPVAESYPVQGRAAQVNVIPAEE